MIKKIISGILLSILVASCQQKRQESEVSLHKPYTIDLSEVEYSEEPQLLSDFVESIEYIKFSEEPLVPDMTCVIEDNKGNIYLDTPNDIYKYTPTGVYVKSLIKKGQGPGEVAHKLSGSVFNIDGDYVLAITGNRTIAKLHWMALLWEWNTVMKAWSQKVYSLFGKTPNFIDM